MGDSFKDIKLTIEDGLKNNMPLEAKLVILGRIHEAFMLNAITYQQSRQLRDMLALPDEAIRFEDFGLSGNDNEYRALVADGEVQAEETQVPTP